MFNKRFTKDSRDARRKLRRKGKTKRKRLEDGCGKFNDEPTIHERPLEAENRKTLGHWEADTVIGAKERACLVTLIDRKSRFLLTSKATKKMLYIRSSVKLLILIVIFLIYMLLGNEEPMKIRMDYYESTCQKGKI